MSLRSAARVGLRWKLVAALVITAAATLAADDAALVPSVERHLQGDRLAGLARVARISELALSDLSRPELRRGSRELREAADRVATAAGGRVALFDARGRVLVAAAERLTTPAPPLPFVRWPATGARAGRLVERVTHGDALVAAHVTSDAGPLTLVLSRSLGGERSATAVVRRPLPFAAAVGLLVAAVLGVLFATRLLARLRRLADGARSLTGEGMASPLPPPGGRDEVSELAAVLDEMRARLWTEYQARQAFLSTASHELRTPLTSLGASLELLEEGLAKPSPSLDAATRRVRAAREQADRLRALATDLLDLNQLDAGVTLRSEAIGVDEIAALVAGEFEPRGRLEVHCEPCSAVGDPGAFARILRTLLDNAFNYGPAGGTVELTVRPDPGGEVAATVTDQGPGIAEDERERIFDRFERGGSALGTGGFGLGLAIARGLAARMDGTLRLVEGASGTAFELRLPAATRPQQELHEIATQP